jgi:hypothetical protein
MKAIITTSLLIILTLSFGLLAALLLPVVYVAWLQWQDIERNTPHVCDAGADPSPTEYVEIEREFSRLYGDDACPHGITPVDNCLMCAIEEPDDEPDIEQPFDTDGGTRLLDWLLEAKRQTWVNEIEQALEKKLGRAKE